MPNGKICYVEIPTADATASAAFYETCFGWKSRRRGDGHLAFDDTTGAVSGSWVTGRPPAGDAALTIYIMVDSLEDSLRKVNDAGGKTVTPPTVIGPSGDAFATFTDPYGNQFGLYQEPRK